MFLQLVLNFCRPWTKPLMKCCSCGSCRHRNIPRLWTFTFITLILLRQALSHLPTVCLPSAWKIFFCLQMSYSQWFTIPSANLSHMKTLPSRLPLQSLTRTFKSIPNEIWYYHVYTSEVMYIGIRSNMDLSLNFLQYLHLFHRICFLPCYLRAGTSFTANPSLEKPRPARCHSRWICSLQTALNTVSKHCAGTRLF